MSNLLIVVMVQLLIIIGHVCISVYINKRNNKRKADDDARIKRLVRQLDIHNSMAVKFIPLLEEIEKDIETHGQPDDERIYCIVKELRILLTVECKYKV